MKDLIKHSGVVKNINGEHVQIHIVQAAACVGCKAKELCSSSEKKDKIIDVYDPLAPRLSVGEEVVVYSTLASGKLATRLAFGGPLAIILVWTFVAIGLLKMNELAVCGILAILLIVYFVILKRVEHRLDKVLTFWIEH